MSRIFFPKLRKQDFVKFLISGGFNTAMTYGVYLILLMFLPYTTSYTISYIAGIVLAYLLNRFFVFKSHQGLKTIALLPLVYVMQYVISMLILWCWVEKLGFNDSLAPIVAIIITIPITYVLSKFVFSK
ncbi:GtrA family protein [Pseudomonas moorei]|nr:GtrA family protein [Pseudomonas moorei]